MPPREQSFHWRFNPAHPPAPPQSYPAPSAHSAHYTHPTRHSHCTKHYPPGEHVPDSSWEVAAALPSMYHGRQPDIESSNALAAGCGHDFASATDEHPPPAANAYYVHRIHDPQKERRATSANAGPAAPTMRMVVGLVCLIIATVVSIFAVHTFLLSKVDLSSKYWHSTQTTHASARPSGARLDSLLKLVKDAAGGLGEAGASGASGDIDASDARTWIHVREALPEWWDEDQAPAGAPRSSRVLLDLIRAFAVLSNRSAAFKPHRARPHHEP